MPIVVRRKNSFRRDLLTVILLSILAGIIGGGLIGLTTGRQPAVQSVPASNG